MTIAYSHNQTVFTDVVNGTTLISQFNNFGNTISVQDDEGRAQYAQFARNDASDTAGKGNQLTLSSKMQNTVINLLSDSSFEDATPWNNATIEATGYRGSNALSLAGNSSAQSAGITAKAGATYTFSGFVKTDSGKVKLGITNGISTVYSQAISAPEWTRLQVSYTNSTGSDQTINGIFAAENGSVYLDCVQFEEAPTASRYNLVQNGDMNSTAYWTATNTGSEDTVSPAPTASPVLSQSAYQITGDFTSYKSVKQTIAVSGGEGDSFVFGGWAMGNSATLTQLGDEQAKDFALKCTLYNGTEVVKEEKVQFNPDVDNWQFISGAIAATGAYTSITIELIYSNNANTVYFDGIQLFKEEFGVSYTYDEDGNVISTVDLQKKKTEYEYDDDNKLTQIIQDGKVKMTYEYYPNSHNVKSATTEEGLKYDFEYDAYGNNTSVSITEGGKTISSSATYTADGNYLSASTDAMGNITTYSYNPNTGLLEWVQLPEDTEATRTEYTYDEMYRVASIAADTETALSLSAEYTYEDDLLTAIQTPTTTYTFEYGNFSLRSKVTVGTYTLASYTYDNTTHRLERLDFGNGGSVQYTYDDYGRLILETYEDGETVSYAYDNSGNLATVTDSETGCVTTYYYDLLNRLVGYREKSATLDHSVIYTYDTQNNLSSMAETIGGATKTYAYTYDEDNRLISMSVGDTTVSYTYDDFGRVSNRTTKHGETVMESITPGYYETENTTSSQIVSYNGYTYAYDGNGNITYCGDGMDDYYYQYDSQNQLIRAESYNWTYIWIWEYDDAGNILSRTIYDFFDTELETPLETVEYQYTDSEWGDLLTSYNGRTITYDVIGNPLSDGQWTYTWQHGRQLATMSNEDTTWNFTYNADGMRTSRTNGTTTYTYVYNGSQLSQMTVDGHFYEFTYDATGTPLTVIVDGNTYYYSTNLQGDVIAVKNQNGIYVAAYTYDAWGNVICNNIRPDVMHNPLLYRGYVYDQETGLYYLQSRYYNPEWGRFINADSFVSTGQGLLGNNMFAYCNNNPVIYVDPTGEFWFLFDFLDDLYYALLDIIAGAILLNRDTLSQEQIEFASVVYSEAGGTNIKTQKAVAHTINNRVLLDHWTNPQNIIDAISYPGQFDGYGNAKYMAAKAYYETGQIPYDMYNNPQEVIEMNKCMFAITPILQGYESDFTGGVLYFHSFPKANDWVYHDYYELVNIRGTTAFWWYR